MTGYHQYRVCIDACLKCAAICNHCASSSARLPEAEKYNKVVQLTMECSVICYAAAELMSLGSSRIKEVAKLCAMICDECSEECREFMDEHCLETAEACTECADACEVLLL